MEDNLFQNIQNRVLGEVKDFDLEELERTNIYAVPENLFENIQNSVMAKVEGFDIEKLDRKNIYSVSENVFETVQIRVLAEVQADQKTPVIRLNWAYAAAASVVLFFGGTFLYNSYSEDSPKTTTNALAAETPKKESQIAYETLQADLTSVESSNQIPENQNTEPVVRNAVQNVQTEKKVKTVTASAKQTEKQMNEYLDAFSSSEIADLASNSNQDVYLDLYN
ncbi:MULTISPECIES: hypothetical protein [unclassified Chryseobacterium]|uniref:hypothetical protein n=1 Tax=unclassified Chryseobacterium TaxID=2593645 RepID=UPI001E517D95|nr:MULTISPECIES: hypothetical protein [unclassified Chryseobacterium]